ncbi:ABC transporter permease [Ruminiclostridium herbifermentans]|uniref:ABC transporter permease n=1 Tax=Ruminiclostridium herbifermentans TaxID=2488810 RepID=A0A4U7JF51_9FIRM|nr:ABC transporter permease [Ruminiclostridium herbifermentans]QNU67383.1 ABC transporter permease [Ruminiclostridium herbifermentans]
MFLIAIRKMFSNKWMLICTLLGSIITVALLSSIPTYTQAIIQRMLVKELENSQQLTGKFPGGYQLNYEGYYVTSNKNSFKTFKSYDNEIKNVIAKSSGVPILTQAVYENAGTFTIDKTESTKKAVSANLCSLSELEEHITILNGKLPSKTAEDGIYEAILSEQAIQKLDLTLGNTYVFKDTTFDAKIKEYKIKVVGIFTYKTLDDPYWCMDIKEFESTIFINQDLMNNSVFGSGVKRLNSASWYFAYDYHQIKVKNIDHILSAFRNSDTWAIKHNLSFKRTLDDILKINQQKISRLEVTLVVLEIPILVILAFYSFMISMLKVDFESNEIAIIKSRGGSSLFVFCTYLIESSIIGIISIIIGPIIGLYFCRILGSSNGFLEFVQRGALPLQLSVSTYIYSIAAVLFISCTMLIPAFMASRTSIVLYKQKNARHKNIPFWKKYFVDVALVALAVYGLYGYKRQQSTLFKSGMDAADMVIDPLLFFISVLFIVGFGLLFLRVFPYIVQFAFWLGRKLWNPVFYASFIQVGRTSGWEQFTMIFIIMALSIGIFSSNSARTINKNMEDKVYYEVGADTVIEGHWTDNQPPPIPGMIGPDLRKRDQMYYYEPPYELYEGLEAAESVTKVFINNQGYAYMGGQLLKQVSIMGIIPNEFGKTAWFRNDLLPYHWYQYLNLMTDTNYAVLVSKAFKEEFGAKEGDQIDLKWGEAGSSISATIFAFIDYWPTLNPNRKVENVQTPYFVVANLDYIQKMNLVEPYQVWLKKKPGVTFNNLYKEINDKKIEIDSINDASQKVIINKNDPMLQGTNGALTLSFIATIIITILGFLIYWILSIKKRILQFGIFRAIGLTYREVIGMIVCEQLLITGSSIFAGIGLGNITSVIFVPLFQMVYSSEQQVPPFKVISDANDYLRLYAIVAIMLVLCFLIIGRLIYKINISQALKLGED